MDERIIYREGYANTLQGGAKTLAVSAATAHANFFGSLFVPLIILSTIWISGPGTLYKYRSHEICRVASFIKPVAHIFNRRPVFFFCRTCHLVQ